MRTHCPDCSAVLDVTEDILNIANGKVRCGDCNTVFNGYDHLEKTDEPVAPILTAQKPQPTPQTSLENEIKELDSIEAELFSLDESFEASSLHIDKVAEATQSPKIDLSFKATSPPEPEPIKTAERPQKNKLDIDLSAKIIERADSPAPKRSPSTSDKNTKPAPPPKKPDTPSATLGKSEAVELPEIDLDLQASEPNPEDFEVEEVISDSSIEDIISKFMAEDKLSPTPSEALDPEASHAMEINEMIAESGIIVDIEDDDDSFKELMDELNKEDNTPLDTSSKTEALAHALSDKASPEDDIFAGLTGVNLDGALSTRATDEAIKSLFPVREEEHEKTSATLAPKTSAQTDSTLEGATQQPQDIEQGMNALFGSEHNLSTTEDPSEDSLFSPTPKNTETKPLKNKKPVSKKLKTLGVLSCILLVLGFCAQALYATRYTLANNPATSSITVQACKYIPLCELRDPSAYQLLNREMTAHPVLENVLVLNVRLINNAKFEQPLPSVVISMTNTLSQQIATNTFKNSEYEQDKLWVNAGQTRDIQILLKDPDARASGFEVGFK